jgi:small-conductance mechanosensitive channel
MNLQTIARWLDSELFRLSNNRVTPLTLVLLVVTVSLSLLLGRLAGRAVSATISRRGVSSGGLAYAMGRITQYSVVVLCVIIGLSNVGIDLSALAAIGAVLTVGIGFGLQNIAQNFVSGLILLIERPVQKGDFVVVGNTLGTVKDIAMRATTITSRDGVTIIVPNSELIGATVVNQSMPNGVFRTRVKVGVSYSSDPERVRDILLRVAGEHPLVLEDPKPAVYFRDFGDSSLDFELAAWLAEPEPEPRVASEIRFAIFKAFAEAKVEIPFPQRDVHVRSGLEGVFRGAPGEA